MSIVPRHVAQQYKKHDSESLAHEERDLFKLNQKVVGNLTGGVGNGDLGTLGLLLGDLGLTASSRGGALYNSIGGEKYCQFPA